MKTAISDLYIERKKGKLFFWNSA